MQRQKNLLSVFSICCLLFTSICVKAQTIGELMIGNACSTIDETSEFDASVDLNGPFDIGTEFVLQISNKSGSFSVGALELDTQVLESSLTSGELLTINFDVIYPFNDGSGTPFGSDDYRARVFVRSTGQRGLVSDAFSVFIYDNRPLILLPRSNCSITTITAEPNDLEEYNWYLFDPMAGEILLKTTTTNTFTPEAPGRYFFRPRLGRCQLLLSQARSNDAIVDDGMSANAVDFQITSSSNSNTICAEESLTLTSSIDDPDFEYQWFLNDQLIEGANTSTFLVTGIKAEGSYRLDITNSEFGFDSDCRTSTSQNRIEVDLLNPTIKLQEPFEIILIPGNTTRLFAEVSGENTSIEWFQDGISIPNSNNEFLDVNAPGIYTAQVTGTSRCSQNTIMSDEQIEVVPFEIESITIVYSDELYTNCSVSEISLDIISVTATNVSGGNVTITDQNIISSLPIVWSNEGEIVEGQNSRSLVINNANQNGSYQAIIGEQPSNSLQVILSLDSVEIQSSSATNELNLGETIRLSVNISDILTSPTYQWTRNGIDITENGENPTLEVTRPGSYSVRIDTDECNAASLDEIVVRVESSSDIPIPNIVTPTLTSNNLWELPFEFSSNSILVTIIDPNGKEVLSQTNYQNNWPASGTVLEESIYYYIITNDGEELKKGTITILR